MPITDYYVTTDAMGSVMAVLDETGNVLERRSYDAFGEATYMLPDGTVVPDSPTGVDIGFQGQLMDQLTGMYQMGYRWYSPILGRWVSRDPIGLKGGVNPLAYVLNVPVTGQDPFGLSCKVTNVKALSRWKSNKPSPDFDVFGSVGILKSIEVTWEREYEITCDCCSWFFGQSIKQKVVKLTREVLIENIHTVGGADITVSNVSTGIDVFTSLPEALATYLVDQLFPPSVFTAGIDSSALAIIRRRIRKSEPGPDVIPTEDDC